jgi:ketosteroid isomerase-like protein
MKRTLLFPVVLIVALTAVAKTPPVDVAAAIRANTEVFDTAMRAGNVDGFMTFYADDAVLMPPNAPAFNGAENVRKFWGGLLAAGTTDVDLTTDDVIVSGDLAVERGHFELTKPFKDSGKYIVVWRNRGGKWQIVDDIFNSSLAPPQ